MDIQRIQAAMKAEGIDSWVSYDFQGKNPIMTYFLQTESMLTRRVFLIIPAEGEPHVLASVIDHDSLHAVPFKQTYYVSWEEMESRLQEFLAGSQIIAMDYAPNGTLPTISRVDAGTVEQIRNMGKTVVSAANIFQEAMAVWPAGVLEAHLEDCVTVAGIKDEAFQYIADQLRQGKVVTEYDAQSLIGRRFEESGLHVPYPVIVAVNAHSSDPHYSPGPDRFASIKKGDWILIDLWAKRPGHDFVYADMTWVAYAGSAPSTQQQEIFDIVAAARDGVVDFVQRCVDQKTSVEGWQVDDVARNLITEAGYGKYFIHRTGHSLGPGDHVHGPGVNIDNLETHDTRKLSAGIGFSVEPGIYLPDFGVRLEIDVFMDESGPQVTTPIQREIICLDV